MRPGLHPERGAQGDHPLCPLEFDGLWWPQCLPGVEEMGKLAATMYMRARRAVRGIGRQRVCRGNPLWLPCLRATWHPRQKKLRISKVWKRARKTTCEQSTRSLGAG